MSDNENKIFQVRLVFPHKISVDKAQTIAQKITKFVEAGISEGGFEILDGSLIFDEKVTWSEDSMVFIYGHKHKHVKVDSTPKYGGEEPNLTPPRDDWEFKK